MQSDSRKKVYESFCSLLELRPEFLMVPIVQPGQPTQPAIVFVIDMMLEGSMDQDEFVSLKACGFWETFVNEENRDKVGRNGWGHVSNVPCLNMFVV